MADLCDIYSVLTGVEKISWANYIIGVAAVVLFITCASNKISKKMQDTLALCGAIILIVSIYVGFILVGMGDGLDYIDNRFIGNLIVHDC